MSSLIAKWSPVTSDFGLIRASLERVVAELQGWHNAVGIEYARTDITSSLADAFTSLLPLSNSKMRWLFLATHSDWVACFQNGIQGSDPFPAMSWLAQHMGVLAMRVCSTPDNARYPATIWEVYAPESLGGQLPLGYRRAISAANDGGRWVFDKSGECFSFEQPEPYGERSKGDRFTREMLRDYLRNFGVELFSDEFLRVGEESPAVRLQRVTMVCQTPEFTLEEVVAGVPWQGRDTVN